MIDSITRLYRELHSFTPYTTDVQSRENQNTDSQNLDEGGENR